MRYIAKRSGQEIAAFGWATMAVDFAKMLSAQRSYEVEIYHDDVFYISYKDGQEVRQGREISNLVNASIHLRN